MFIADSLIVIGTLRCLLPGRMFIVADKVSNGLELTVCEIHTLIQRASVLLQTGSFSSVWRETNTSPRWSEETFFQSDVAQNKTHTHTHWTEQSYLALGDVTPLWMREAVDQYNINVSISAKLSRGKLGGRHCSPCKHDPQQYDLRAAFPIFSQW